MKNIQELKDNLIASESNEHLSPAPHLVVVGKKEFDALMVRLEDLKGSDSLKGDNLVNMIKYPSEQNKLGFSTSPILIAVALRDDIMDHINKAKLSILRGMHSGDKVANILTSLVKTVREAGDTSIWRCPECDREACWDSDDAGDGETPVCPKCDIDMAPDRIFLFDTQEWKDAEAYALRITQIKNSKKDKS